MYGIFVTDERHWRIQGIGLSTGPLSTGPNVFIFARFCRKAPMPDIGAHPNGVGALPQWEMLDPPLRRIKRLLDYPGSLN